SACTSTHRWAPCIDRCAVGAGGPTGSSVARVTIRRPPQKLPNRLPYRHASGKSGRSVVPVRVPWLRLLKLAGRSRGLMLATTALGLLQSLVFVPVAFLVQRMFNHAIPGHDRTGILLLGGGIAALGLLAAAIGVAAQRIGA